MNQLRPQVVEERKRRLLQWVIHRYIRTSVPVASQAVAEESGMELSSASIRNILKELEAEGFLHRPHASAGRVPTDKGYRFYVDYLLDVQRRGAEEKERIETGCARRLEELDRLLGETSKLLARTSRSAGLVLAPRLEKHALRRVEVIPLGGARVLVVMVTQAGLVRHWPVELSVEPSAAQVNALNRFLNETLESKTMREARAAVEVRIAEAERELRDLGTLASRLLDAAVELDDPEALYLDGAAQVLARPEGLGDLREVQSLIEVMESKRTLAGLLQAEMEDLEREAPRGRGRVHVRIGEENRVPGLRHVSLVTTAYRFRDQVVGVLGILGSKRMEYDRMMGLVDHVSDVVSRSLESWQARQEPFAEAEGDGSGPVRSRGLGDA